MADRNTDPNKAVDFLIANAEKFAKAKAANAREQFAYSHPEYVELLECE